MLVNDYADIQTPRVFVNDHREQARSHREEAIWQNRQHNWHAGQTLRCADHRQSFSTCRGSVAPALSVLAFVC